MFGDEENVGQEQTTEAPAPETAPASESPAAPETALAEHEVKCPQCGAVFSKGDTACPNCRRPNQP